ncbi:ran-binding protein 9 [Bacillus rossius redtenbacheri]|uniref:ran-binding protein 9 n=1 Tax=Bacillus rossius redtenbacheri TaxID=93214 RepID=UPI002FDCFC8C
MTFTCSVQDIKMAAVSNGRSATDSQVGTQNAVFDRLKLLYPMVNEEETPLPRSWSPKDKYNYIGLSQNNLRVHYKGHGKTHKDAASVRATHAIPAACGLYYFEVKIVSKGRDGYMGIGLSAQGVNMNRLPGWDKHSYGYHGDDGHSFCSSGTGQPYGPTFTTGDVIGCGVNLIENTCFYTKNGHNLGVAFTDLPPNLYPTVGLQTPGEIVDANFGQSPFVFDIEDMMKELRARTQTTIHQHPVPDNQGEWQATLHKMVSTYLVHHGYCATAEAFSQVTDQAFEEDITSIKNRQRILKLVLAGRMGEAIEMTSSLYPGLLERNQNLLFLLKCRQFVEMVNGSDSEVCPPRCPRGQGLFSPAHAPSGGTPPRPTSPAVQTSVIQSTKSYASSPNNANNANNNNNSSSSSRSRGSTSVEENNLANSALNGGGEDRGGQGAAVISPFFNLYEETDIEMELPDEVNGHVVTSANGYQNGNSHPADKEELEDTEEMETDSPASRRQLCGGSKTAVERMLEFGRELYNMSVHLRQEQGKNENNKKMLQDAFSLLAYSNPWSSPVGWQLDPVQRETVCAVLNSTILESKRQPRRPPLEVALAHAKELVQLMSRSGLGSCAFASVEDLLGH